MKNTLSLIILLAAAVNLNAQSSERLLLDGWKFHKGPCTGAQAVAFDDMAWQSVRIPHDWAISGPFDKDIDKQVVAIEQNGERVATEKTGRSGSLPWIGEGWYRTSFEIPEGYSHAELIFDGAMSEPVIYVDGVEAGHWAYGYSTFNIDITPFIKDDGSDVLPAGRHIVAVHLNNREESSRWYPGAGLYRPVRLLLAQRDGFETFGIFARTTRLDGINEEATAADAAILTVSTDIRSLTDTRRFKVLHRVLDASGSEVASSETSCKENPGTIQVLHTGRVELWNPEHPVLYTVVSELYDGDVLLDRRETPTGFRTVEYGDFGFRLNDQPRKFKGVCLHHDLGPLGTAFNKAAFRRQVRLLKEIGCDAIRTSHNMPAPWQMDICDEMGMLVMAESTDMWISAKCRNGYSLFFDEWWERDYTNLVRVHRNHPSIVMWSIGNEIPDQGSPLGLEYTRRMQALIHSLDGTRPCTQGLDQGDACIRSGVFQASDVPGFNYRLHKYELGHANSPTGVLLGTETASTISSRGVYKFPVAEVRGESYEDGQISSYDMESCFWSNLPEDDWMWQDKAPWVMGEFVWTGFDYLGEPTPYDEYWPSRSSYFGIYDLAGLAKDRAWLYRIHWAPEKETLHILPHWTWKGREGEVTPVFCYTSYPEAELFINGKSQGRRRHIDLSLEEYKDHFTETTMPWGDVYQIADPETPQQYNRLDRYRLRWMDTVYEPGELRVVAYDDEGHEAAEEVIHTAGWPHHIELSVDRQIIDCLPVDSEGLALDTPDLAFITAYVVDRDGNLCPDADNLLSLKISGKSIAFNSCCNGDATSTEVFTSPALHCFKGKAVFVVEAKSITGASCVSISSKGLHTGSIIVGVQ